MARRRNPIRPIWVAGIAGVSILLIGGIAMAASKPSGGGGGPPTCPPGQGWIRVTDSATAVGMLNALGYQAGQLGPPPGTYYGTYNGQAFKYVNNGDPNATAFYACG